MSPRLIVVAVLTAVLSTAPLLAQEDQRSAGQADLDKATELKINATDLNDLSRVIRLLDSAMDKGLDEGNRAFAEDMLIASLLQRAGALSEVLLKQSAAQARANPQYLQLRMMVLNDLQRIVRTDDTQTDAYLLLGQLQSAPAPLGDRVAARDALTKVIEQQDIAPEKLAQAYALRSVTRSDALDTMEDLDRAVELQPDNPRYRLLRARQAHGQDQFGKAADDVEKAIELDPADPKSHQLRAIVLMSQGKLNEAVDAFNKATELAPEDIGGYQIGSQLFDKLGDTDKALEQIDKAIELQPDNLATQLLRVNLLIKSQRYDDALADVDTLIEKQDNFMQAKLIRMQLLEELGRDEEALAMLQELTEKLPNQPELHLQLAAHYMDNQQPTLALEQLTKVLELAPDNQIARRLRGDVYLSVGKHREALEDYQAAHAQEPDDPGLLNNYAWTLATSTFDELRDGKRALELAKRACELSDYKAPHILSTLAAAYAETGDFESAVDWSQRAVELAREGTEAEQLEALQKELKQYEAGQPVRELQQADDLQPADQDTPGEDDPNADEQPSPQQDAAPARTIDF